MDAPVVLLALANDAQHSLNLAEEERSIRDTLSSFHDSDIIEFHSIGHTTLLDVYKSLNRFHNRISIFHFAGHSNGEFLQLEDKLVGRRSLSTLLGMAPNLKLVFLNGCTNKEQVAALHRAGVKTIIATSNEINDKTAKDFAYQFYLAMIGGKNIEDSFETAKNYLMGLANETASIHSRGIALPFSDSEFPWSLYATDHSSVKWKLPNPIQLTETIKEPISLSNLTEFQLGETVVEAPEIIKKSTSIKSIKLESHDRRVQNGQGAFLINGEALLGRGSDCDIVILEKGVSRKHARFLIEENQVVLLDENSTNGTFWNNIRVSRMPITQNGILSLHTVKFRVSIIA